MTGPFVKLKFHAGKANVWVNVANIASLRPVDGLGDKQYTRIDFVGGDWFTVQESPEEILEKARQAVTAE